MKILLIDDDVFALKLLTRQLDSLGYKDVIACESGDEALTKLKNGLHEIDTIFCDLQMPHIDGVEMIRHLVRIGYTGFFVLVSGEDERILQTVGRLATGHHLKLLGTLQKPISPNGLHEVLMRKFSYPAQVRKDRKSYDAAMLGQAILNNELVNYYQPKVDLISGKVFGVETLVRWQHPKDGLIYPDQFIATAEEHDLIDDLTQRVFINAMRQARVWEDAGFTLQLAVNVSMSNLSDLNFPDMIEREANKYGIRLMNLILEVTESRLMNNPLAVFDILTRLRLKHIGLSIDDFGTGHSSLSQLRDIPFTELKLDRSFVHGSSSNVSQRSILEASLKMAKQLGIKTVAEGIEDLQDWEFLRDLGCDLAQGYFIAKPMPASEVVDWIKNWDIRYSVL